MIFTSSGDEGDRQRPRPGAATDLTKPVKFTEFCDAFPRVLKEHL